MNLEDKLKKELELKEKYFNSLTNTILDKIKEEKDDFNHNCTDFVNQALQINLFLFRYFDSGYISKNISIRIYFLMRLKKIFHTIDRTFKIEVQQIGGWCGHHLLPNF